MTYTWWAAFIDTRLLSGVSNGPALSMFNYSNNRINIDVLVKPTVSKDGALAQPFGISDLIIPSQGSKAWNCDTLTQNLSLDITQRKPLKNLTEAEFAVTIRELATE